MLLSRKTERPPFQFVGQNPRLIMKETIDNFVCDAILFDSDGVQIDLTNWINRHWKDWADTHDLDVGSIMKVASGRLTIETIRLVAPHLDAEK